MVYWGGVNYSTSHFFLRCPGPVMHSFGGNHMKRQGPSSYSIPNQLRTSSHFLKITLRVTDD